MKKPKVLVILGPTAVGKSDIAVRLAKKLNGEVISADSRQVYKGLNVGTGKITKKEMLGIPHHLLSVADPKKQFSVSEYKKLAENSIRYIVRYGKLPIVVGGTGFYIDAVACEVNFPDVPPDPKFRERMLKKSADELFKMLQKKDPVRAQSIDRHNKLRLSRALEIVEALGKVPLMQEANSPHEFVYIGINLPKNELEKRIYERLLKRLPGMIKEAKKLHAIGLTWQRMHELGLEYRYLALYLQNKLTKEETIEELYKEIKRYAKRQMTWFKRKKNIKWFLPTEIREIEKYLRKTKLRTITSAEL